MNTRAVGFVVLLVVCLTIGVAYVSGAARRGAFSADKPVEAAGAPAGLLTGQPRLLSLNKANDGRYNHMQLSALQPESSAQVFGELLCERGYFAGGDTGVGICLTRDFSNPLRAVITGTVFAADLRPLMHIVDEGIPSRARVSNDGTLAAYTVFVTGHSYTDVGLSTRTVILDVARRREIGNLETFTVFRHGAPIRSPDFNFWGVTFADDGDTFYAKIGRASCRERV